MADAGLSAGRLDAVARREGPNHVHLWSHTQDGLDQEDRQQVGGACAWNSHVGNERWQRSWSDLDVRHHLWRRPCML